MAQKKKQREALKAQGAAGDDDCSEDEGAAQTAENAVSLFGVALGMRALLSLLSRDRGARWEVLQARRAPCRRHIYHTGRRSVLRCLCTLLSGWAVCEAALFPAHPTHTATCACLPGSV